MVSAPVNTTMKDESASEESDESIEFQGRRGGVAPGMALWKTGNQVQTQKEQSSSSSPSSSSDSNSSNEDSEDYYKPLPVTPQQAKRDETPIKLQPEPESFEAVNMAQTNLLTMLKEKIESLDSCTDEEEEELEIVNAPKQAVMTQLIAKPELFESFMQRAKPAFSDA